MTFAEYQAIDAINASAIVAGRVSMRHMHAEMKGERKADSPAMAWGRKVHAAVLEPDRFFGSVAIWEGAVKRGKDWDAFRADHPDGDLVTTRSELADLESMKRAIWTHPVAARLLDGCATEATVQWEAHYGAGKGRLDAQKPGCIIDYKTTRNIEPRAFYRAAFGLGYHIRMGWYVHGWEIAKGDRPDVFLIVQESDAPWDCWVCQIPKPILRAGENEAKEIAVRYAVARESGRFKGVSDECLEYELPAWAGGDIDQSTGTMEASAL